MKSHLKYALVLLAGMTTHAMADITWGINGHPITAYPGITIEEQIGYVADLGMKSYHVNISYLDTAEHLARIVEVAKAHGVEILPVLTPGELDLEQMSADELYKRAFDFAAEMAKGFGNDVSVFELGNEMENFAIIQPCETRDDGTQYPCEWGPAGGVGPLEYHGPRWAKVSAALKGMSEGIHSVNPAIKRAVGTAGWGHVGAFERMKADNLDWDISVWHVYGEDPEWALDIIQDYGKPIWITELNTPLGSEKGEEVQAKDLDDMMTKIRELSKKYKVEAAHIYELLDEPYWGGFEGVMGLVKLVNADDGWATGAPKEAYQTVRTFIRGAAGRPTVTRNCELKKTYEGELIDHQIEYSYCLVLGRWPDGHGAASWKRRLASNDMDVYDLLWQLATSGEFNARNGTHRMSNTAFVGFVFQVLLLREPDRYGLTTYVKQLNADVLSRENVIDGIIRSSEFEARHASLFEKADVAEAK